VLAEYFAQGSKELLDGRLPEEFLDDTGETITDPVDIRRLITERVLTRFFVLFFCSRPAGEGTGGINLNRGALSNYIRGRSKWIEETLSFSNAFLWDAPKLRPSIGGEANLLTKNDAVALLGAVQDVPVPPEAPLKTQYLNLLHLLKIAAREPRYRLLIWTL
jgi:hypothetical protein